MVGTVSSNGFPGLGMTLVCSFSCTIEGLLDFEIDRGVLGEETAAEMLLLILDKLIKDGLRLVVLLTGGVALCAVVLII